MFSLSSFTLRFNGINQRKKDLMMNHFISNLTTKFTSKTLAKVTSRFSPIVLTSLQLSLMLTLMLMILPSVAEQVDKVEVTSKIAVKQSYSAGQSAAEPNKLSNEQLLQLINQRITLGDSDQRQNKALAITRDELMNKKHQQARKQISASLFKKMAEIPNSSTASRSFSDGSFVIYEAYSQLIEDYDADGYYQTFSVTFDADLITYSAHDEAAVYAELYLSENGGPWEHYYTTDSFVIHGESSDDEFEVYSTLQQGFNSNHYDVLIDLYEVGYANIIASYSSDDNNSLYALPLESSDYDVEYEETHIHSGSFSFIALLLLGGLILVRQFTFNQLPIPVTIQDVGFRVHFDW